LGFQLNRSTGALTPVAGSPFVAGDDPSTIASDPLGRFVFIGEDDTVLGGRNTNCVDNLGFILTEQVNPATGSLTKVQTLPINGACASAMVVDPTGKFLYVATLVPNDGSGQVQGFSIAANGNLTELPGSPYAIGPQSNGLAIHPSGKYLYATNPNLTTLDRDTTTGVLKVRSVVNTPKIFVTLNPAGDFLLASESPISDTSQFHVDSNSGDVAATETRVPLATVKLAADPKGAFFATIVNTDPAATVRGLTTLKFDSNFDEFASSNTAPTNPGQTAVDLAFEPQGQFLYSVQAGGNTIAGFSLDRTSGALTPIASKPIAVPATAIGLAIVTPQ
jgi:6-phosphogluconolactonase (cycloisomerase 2 family)